MGWFGAWRAIQQYGSPEKVPQRKAAVLKGEADRRDLQLSPDLYEINAHPERVW